jgi:thioredoxin-like negative regulator of GroEL
MKVYLFHSKQCEACRLMVPALLASEILPNVITYLDIDEKSNECAPWGLRAVPTMVILNNHNRELSRRIGFQSHDEVLEWLLEFGVL